MGCSATGSVPPTTPGARGDDSSGPAASSRIDLDDVSLLDDALGCTRSDILLDDLDFFDAMRGIDCFFTDDEAVLLRAYERESSVDQVLVEWLPTFSRANQVIVGANWFAVGAPERLLVLAARFGVAAEPTAAPEPRPLPLTPMQERVGACTTTVSQFIGQAVMDPAGTRDALDDAEAVLPGITSFVERIADRIAAAPAPDSTPGIDARLSAYGPEIKRACAARFETTGSARPNNGG